METAGLYAFGKIFNHEVISLSTVLANRASGLFSSNPSKSIEKMILNNPYQWIWTHDRWRL